MTKAMLVGVLAGLAACTTQGVTGYRDPEVPVSSLAVYDPARMAGDWVTVAAFGAEAACGALTERWAQATPTSLTVTGTSCRNGVKRDFATRAQSSGPGRFQRQMAGGTEDMWVLWADADDRVAVIGTPDGRFGRVMAQPGAARADLLAAARSVLEFNGYDLARLVMISH